MAECNSGIRRMLTISIVYQIFQKMIWSQKGRKKLINYLIQAKYSSGRILDVGCGPGDLYGELGHPDGYVGVDYNAKYIREAKRRYPRANFVHINVDNMKTFLEGSFDSVVMIGLMHHLEDVQIIMLFELLKNFLAASGTIITLDPIIVEGASWVEKILIANDRGKRVRSKEGYINLVSGLFPKIQTTVLKDLFKLPISVCVLEISC